MPHMPQPTPAPYWQRPQIPGQNQSREVRIPVGSQWLHGDLVLPAEMHGLVLFAHGSGSGRHSSRNRLVAAALHQAGIGTLLLDLLTAQEEQVDIHSGEHRFNIALLTDRVLAATLWVLQQPGLWEWPLGYFGASTGSAAALIAAARLDGRITAVVSRGGRPDLAGQVTLANVTAPTLLIVERRINAVAVEADWPDAWRVHRYVSGHGEDRNATQALGGFERFPAWMWRNTEVARFVEWLRNHNLSSDWQVGFYGLDLYSLFRSMQQVLDYLDRIDPAAAQRARARYACFDHVREDSQAYGYGASSGLSRSCEDEVVSQLSELMQRAGEADPDELFHARQNARLVRNAEEYYRSMFGGRVSSWNLRDMHMMETTQALERHLQRAGRPARLAIWAHNSHLGDAGATDMAEHGQWNLGQLLRQRYGQEVFILGMSTYTGTVTAARDWDEPAQRRQVRPGLAGSWEDLLHQAEGDRFMLLLRGNEALQKLTGAARLQRAIGVVYRPETERQSHYLMTRLPQQFDALLHIDRSHAIEPLDKGPVWVNGEVPETYPSGI